MRYSFRIEYEYITSECMYVEFDTTNVPTLSDPIFSVIDEDDIIGTVPVLGALKEIQAHGHLTTGTKVPCIVTL
jgi:hypothetical protein